MIQYRYNVMNINSIQAFAGVRGGFHNDCRDVYFVRFLGVSPTLEDEVRNMEREMRAMEESKKQDFFWVSGLPKLTNPDDVDYYTKCYEEWKNSEKNQLKTRVSAGNPVYMESLAAGMEEVLNMHRVGKSICTESMEKNFAVKLLHWFDTVMGEQMSVWTPASCIKVVAQNVIKEAEYLFYRLLTRVGADCLLLQTAVDIGEDLKGMHLSGEIRGGEFCEIRLPEYGADTGFGTPAGQSGFSGSDGVSAAGTPAGQSGFSGSDGVSAAGFMAAAAHPTVVLPPHPRTAARAERQSAEPAGRPTVVLPPHPGRVSVTPPVTSGAPSRTSGVSESTGPSVFSAPPVTSGTPSRIEKSYEELAALASSVVMIEEYDAAGKSMGSGSGVMVGEKGYIVTNCHVVAGGHHFAVRIENDENTYMTDELIKYNNVTDLAVLRIDRILRPLPVYHGNGLARGQKVMAIGSPYGLFNSVSEGIISGFRKIDMVDMIQHTAPISPGSSGGAVLNMQGELIGINRMHLQDGQNINMAVGHEAVNQFIRGFC